MAASNHSQVLNNIEKQHLISMLILGFAVLQTKAKLLQEEFANIIGILLQTYGVTEHIVQTMSWNTYILLAFYYDND